MLKDIQKENNRHRPQISIPPQSQADAKRLTTPLSPGCNPSKNLHIRMTAPVLLVEDNDMVRSLVEDMLTWLGYKVLSAQDGVQAIHLFTQRSKDIGMVISDVAMPRKNGWQLLADMRNLRSSVPVILISGYYEAPINPKKANHQPQAFLHKPFTVRALQETIDGVLESYMI
jgi:DNA-binding NtrC family response regulator